MAVIDKKAPTREMSQGTREVENEIQLESTIIQKKQSCLSLLIHSFHFNLAELIFLKQIFL